MKPIYLKSILNLSGASSIGNGLWMLFFAQNWYDNMPVAAHDTGPLNAHFVHDVGLVYLIAGLALLWCTNNLQKSLGVYTGVLLFYVGHALIHVVEILLGLLPPSHWWIDFPLVFVPAMTLIALLFPIIRLGKQ